MIYIIGTLSTLLLAYIAVHIDKSRLLPKYLGDIYKRFFMFLSVIPLSIISAVRYGVGTDFFSYYRIYERHIITNTYEKGFEWLINLLYKISNNPQVFFVGTSFIICILYIYAIYRNSIDPVYSILLFVISGEYFSSMNIIRQYITITIVLFAIPYIKSRDWLKMLIVAIIASLFHTSAFIIILLYILYNIELKPIVYAFSIVITFVLANIIKALLLPFLNRFTTYGRFFLETSAYSESNIDWVKFLIYLSIFMLMTYGYRLVKENENLKLMYTAVWMSLIIVASGAAMPINVTRMALYMNPIIAIYMPEAINYVPNRRLKPVVKFAVTFCYTVVTIYLLVYTGWHNAWPYRTYWE